MAGIDRTDSIRRPVDSSLSTRTAHRGGDGMLQPQREALAQLRQSAPAIAVVVEQHDLGSPRKPLFELLLSANDQWLRVQSNKAFQPGTVLLIEATTDDQIRVLPKPEPTQLNRMMQASLQFWQAHTLPRVHATTLPSLPAAEVQQQLANAQPELKPLIDWLNQKPTLNARTLASWFQEFTPLAKPSGQAIASDTGTKMVNPRAENQALTPLNVNAATTSTPTTGAHPSAALQPLTAAIRTSLPLLQQTPLRWLPMQQQATFGQWQPILPQGPAHATTLIASPDTLLKLASAGTAKALVPVIPVTTTPSQGGVEATQPAPTLLRVQLVDAAVLQQPQRLPAVALVNPPAPFAIQPVSAASYQITVTPLALSPAPTGTETATTNAAQKASITAQTGFAITVTRTNSATDASTQPTTTEPTTRWQPLPPRPGSTEQLPLEMRLAQWLTMIDNRIRQHPASLQQSLAQRAQQLLHNDVNYGLDKPLPPPPLPQVHNSAATNPAQQTTVTELQPLLQLRHWLEAVQGKTQNNAIQQTLSALTSGGDGQNQAVQQLSIPLVWMGPASWANLEWWQEQASDAETKDGSSAKRLWRFRLFFELEPLAPLCADLVWEAQQTDLTFWSEDRSTLAFLNSHLSTLEQWTEGLGERQLHTRHGMPRKKSTPEADNFKPLVDIHT